MAHRLGMIGYGGMAGWHHNNINQYYEDLKVTAAFDIDAGALERARSNGLNTYDTLEAFLASNDFDIVLVATPNNFHCEYACRALEAGYHVICEKPVTMNCEELKIIDAAAKKCGKVFTVHQNRRWDEDYRIVRAAIEKGLVGKPFTIESRVHGQGGIVHGWREFKVAGGGMLFDWGVHLIDQILDMYQEKVISVSAHLHSVRTPEVDDYFKLMMRMESGISVQIEVGTYNLIQGPRWYVCGDGGALIINDWDCKGKIIHASEQALNWEPVVVQTKAGPTRTMAPRPKETLEEVALPNPQSEPSWMAFYRNVMDTIDGKADLAVTVPSVMRVLKVIEAAFESDAKGIDVSVNI